jgi:hypothetical protein
MANFLLRWEEITRDEESGQAAGSRGAEQF